MLEIRKVIQIKDETQRKEYRARKFSKEKYEQSGVLEKKYGETWFFFSFLTQQLRIGTKIQPNC